MLTKKVVNQAKIKQNICVTVTTQKRTTNKIYRIQKYEYILE